MLVFEAVLIINEKSTMQWNEMSQFILIPASVWWTNMKMIMLGVSTSTTNSLEYGGGEPFSQIDSVKHMWFEHQSS